MTREHFTKTVADVLDSLPAEFRGRICNVAVLVEDISRHQALPQSGERLPPRSKRIRLHVLIPLRLGGLLELVCAGTVARVDQLGNGPVGVGIRASVFEVPR